MPFQLPDIVLLQVFLRITDTRTLCDASEVCLQWYRVSQSERLLWRRIRLSAPYVSNYTGHKRNRTTENDLRGIALTIEVMTRRGQGHLEKLDSEHVVQTPRPPSVSDMRMIKKRAKYSSQILKLQGKYAVRASVVIDIISACSKLRILRTPANSNMNLNTLRKITKQCKQLEDISVAHCYKIRGTASALKTARVPVCGTLKKITISFTNIMGLPFANFGCDFRAIEEIHADSCLKLEQVVPDAETMPHGTNFFAKLTMFSANMAEPWAIWTPMFPPAT